MIILLAIILVAIMVLAFILALNAKYKIEFFGGVIVAILATANLMIVLGHITGVFS